MSTQGDVDSSSSDSDSEPTVIPRRTERLATPVPYEEDSSDGELEFGPNRFLRATQEQICDLLNGDTQYGADGFPIVTQGQIDPISDGDTESGARPFASLTQEQIDELSDEQKWEGFVVRFKRTNIAVIHVPEELALILEEDYEGHFNGPLVEAHPSALLASLTDDDKRAITAGIRQFKVRCVMNTYAAEPGGTYKQFRAQILGLCDWKAAQEKANPFRPTFGFEKKPKPKLPDIADDYAASRKSNDKQHEFSQNDLSKRASAKRKKRNSSCSK